MLEIIFGSAMIFYSIYKIRLYILIDKRQSICINNYQLMGQKVLDWCLIKFNYCDGKPPSIIFDSNPYMLELGIYEILNCRIIINQYKINSNRELANVILHEYHHHLQNLIISKFQEDYNSSIKKFGYSSNFFEIQANIFAEKYTNICLKDLGLFE